MKKVKTYILKFFNFLIKKIKLYFASILYKILKYLDYNRIYKVNFYLDPEEGKEINSGLNINEPIKSVDDFESFIIKFTALNNMLKFYGDISSNNKYEFYLINKKLIEKEIN